MLVELKMNKMSEDGLGRDEMKKMEKMREDGHTPGESPDDRVNTDGKEKKKKKRESKGRTVRGYFIIIFPLFSSTLLYSVILLYCVYS